MKLILALLFAASLYGQTCTSRPGGTLCNSGGACTLTGSTNLGTCANTAIPGGTPKCTCLYKTTTITPGLTGWGLTMNDNDGVSISMIPVTGGQSIANGNDYRPLDDGLLNLTANSYLALTFPSSQLGQDSASYLWDTVGGINDSFDPDLCGRPWQPACPPSFYYITLPVGGVLSATFSFTASPDALLNYFDQPSNTGLAAPAVRLYISGVPPTDYNDSLYRWYSIPSVVIGQTPTQVGQSVAAIPTNGTITFSVPLVPGAGLWLTPDSGSDAASAANTAAFAATLAQVEGLAVVFGGGDYYAHGLQLTQGTATFTLQSLSYHP